MLSTRPLAGITVLEIGHSVAAPYAGLILGELGAEVIKLENPTTGDYTRDWGPPFWHGTAPVFEAINRSKHGIAVDLDNDEAVAALKELIGRRVDVVLHNLKPGALARRGLDARALLALKPELIYCNVSAFGAQGPLRHLPGYDPLMQAFGGIMSLTGVEGGPPVRVGVSIIDMATGMWAAIAILAALRERASTGRGGTIDTSLYETTLAWIAAPVSAYLCSGAVAGKTGSATASIVPYQAFETSDGHLMIAAGNDNLFRRLSAALDLPALADDARFRTNGARVTNRDVLLPILAKRLRGEPAAVWSARLDAAGVPNGPLQSIDQVVAHPQTAALKQIQRSPDAALSLVGLPLSFDGERPAFTRRAPSLGQHTEELLPQAAQAMSPQSAD